MKPWAWVGISAVVLTGCASRAPVSYPQNAPSSASAPEARLADVTLALSADPPLPSQTQAGWQGLADAPAQGSEPSQAAESTEHAQHGGHHHHGAH
jgi:hypothetical protein